MKNYISIDASENSTAVVVKSNHGYYLFNYTTTDPNYKWMKLTKDFINLRFFKYEKNDDYSESEMCKLNTFSKIALDILKDVLTCIDSDEETIIGIEGYNYNSFSGSSIIDIVGVSTCIRLLLLLNIPNIVKYKILSPKTIKTRICEIVYGMPEPKIGKKGKPLKEKLVPVSKYGVKGGDFDKNDMMKAIFDGEIISPIYKFYLENKIDLLSQASVKKPMEDINDAILLMKILETDY